jgi:hypothetical protein
MKHIKEFVCDEPEVRESSWGDEVGLLVDRYCVDCWAGPFTTYARYCPHCNPDFYRLGVQ